MSICMYRLLWLSNARVKQYLFFQLVFQLVNSLTPMQYQYQYVVHIMISHSDQVPSEMHESIKADTKIDIVHRHIPQTAIPIYFPVNL